MYLSNLVDVLWLLSVMVFFNIVKKGGTSFVISNNQGGKAKSPN